MTSASAGKRLPDYIIAGAMRCGTTALNSYLRDHPDIAVSSAKEVHYFDAKYDLGLDWYREQFPDSAGAVAVGEATPNYIFRSEALDRIQQTLPDVKLLIMLRNPMDRAYSHYWHDRARAKIDEGFAEVVDRELGGEDIGPAAYVARGRYGEQIESVLARFDRSAVHVETFDDLVAKPGEVYASVCRFIGVDDTYRPANLGQPVNPFLEFRSLRLREWARRLPKRAESLVGRFNRRTSSGYPPMDPAVRGRLKNVFDEANAKLEILLGWQSPDWS